MGIFGMLATVLVLLLGSASRTNSVTDPTDVKVLKELLQNVGGPSKLPAWGSGDPCDDKWPYLQCDGTSVIGIQLKNTNLHGQLPSSLKQMSNLRAIAFQGNNFTGPLPSLSGLSHLATAYLNGQSFTSIPPDFFQGLISLTLIALDYSPLNQADGGWSLPTDVSSLTELTTLSLTQTCLSGTLPDFLATLPKLQNLQLAYNLLTGSIPPSYANAGFVKLELNNQLSSTKLTGSIQPVGSMQSLVELWLQVNAFSGSIPPGLGSLISLSDCRLNDNQLVGPIPPTFSSSVSLKFFSVRHNQLIGPVPKIPSLNADNYAIDGNNFCVTNAGADCMPEVTALLSFMRGVQYPSLLASSWGGNNPCALWLGISCDPRTGKVISINLPNRNLSGTIAPEVGNLTSLQFIVLNTNSLTGSIPETLAALPSLKRVFLQNNNLVAPVPAFAKGIVVDISGNPNIDNQSKPSTPSPVPPRSSPSTSSPPAVPHFTSPVSSPSPISPSLSPVSVSSPLSPLSHLPSVSTPSTNTTPGSIPLNSPPIAAAPSLSEVSSSNKVKKQSTILVGSIAAAVCVTFIAAIFVCILVQKWKKEFRASSQSNLLVHPLAGSSCNDAMKFSLGNRVVDVSQAQSNTSDSTSGDIKVVEAGNLLISIQVLRNVTNNFSPENVLGKGGFGVVYKGELDDGTKIAVKRMEASVVSKKGLNEFHSEIAVLTKVRHRNLVALLGYCIDGNERLLVYEYMSLGTLSQHLFDNEKLQLQPLSLKRRLSIALDVARGMEYLHGLAHASFIHRDLKPSNILLGDEYRAKVSDFGLVKLAAEGKSAVETRLAGTFGYLAPEYAVTGRVTTKSDVFSFGVVLMELMSGRKALDETLLEESGHLVAWFKRLTASSRPKEDFMQAIDPILLQGTDSESDMDLEASLQVVAELAGHCTLRDPWQRPDMSYAVTVLSPLVELWKPANVDSEDDMGVDLDMTLPQALKKWQAYEDCTLAFFSRIDLESTNGSMPSRPTGFADSFTSSDGR